VAVEIIRECNCFRWQRWGGKRVAERKTWMEWLLSQIDMFGVCSNNDES
jgi:hypothetical protein